MAGASSLIERLPNASFIMQSPSHLYGSSLEELTDVLFRSRKRSSRSTASLEVFWHSSGRVILRGIVHASALGLQIQPKRTYGFGSNKNHTLSIDQFKETVIDSVPKWAVRCPEASRETSRC